MTFSNFVGYLAIECFAALAGKQYISLYVPINTCYYIV